MLHSFPTRRSSDLAVNPHLSSAAHLADLADELPAPDPPPRDAGDGPGSGGVAMIGVAAAALAAAAVALRLRGRRPVAAPAASSGGDN
jgi:hypothetical protein